jgi:hypothetical protein
LALGDSTSYKRLYMTFRNADGRRVNITLNNPKTFADGDYASLQDQDTAIEGVMDTIISKNIFTTTGGDIVEKLDGRIVTYSSEDAMDV